MENEDSKMESEAVVETVSPVADKEASKTNVIPVPSESELSEMASSEKSTQNGALAPNKIPENGDNQTEESAISAIEPVEETQPKITENGNKAETEAETVEASVEEATKTPQEVTKTPKEATKAPQEEATKTPQAEAQEQDKVTVEATKDIIEEKEKPTRVTRGTKRKANDEINETPNEGGNKTTEQKENQNDSLYGTEGDLTLKTYSSSNVMGKGRRARVPNKRYSDISLTSSKRAAPASPKVPQMLALEESLSVKDEFLGDFAGFDKAITAATSAKKSRDRSNLQDPKYLKPFKYGWKRELVWRSTVSHPNQMGDIYYYEPNGKKLRSLREISDHLTNKNLTLDNFSFFKVPLCVNEPDKEIVRNAADRKLMGSKAASQKTNLLVVGSTPTPSSSKRRSTLAVINAAQEKEVASPSSPRNRRRSPVKRGKPSTAKKNKESDLSTIAEPMEVDVSPTKSNVIKTSKPCQPCSISCDGLQGIIPMLQCRMCLCLYHYQCVGLDTDKISSYVCKNCQDQEPSPNSAIALPPSDTNIMPPPPPVTNTTKVKRTQRPEFCVPLPPLIPKPFMAKKINSKEPSIREMPTLTPKPQGSSSSLVGALTSYHPHNVQIVNSATTPTKLSRPQMIEYMHGRRFIVIPKHNYMSVSSNTSRSDNASASTGPKISLESNQEVPEVRGFSPSKGGISPVLREEEEKIEDDDVQAVPGDNVNNETSVRQSIQALNQPKGQARNLKPKSVSISSEPENVFMGNYMQNISFGYNTLLYVFQYLKVQDLLRAGCVCTMWRDIASNPILWRTVRMKNSQVYSFEGMANTLKKYNTVNLDLRKMLLPNNGDDIWPEFSKSIGKVQSLRKIEFCRCPASVMEQLPVSNPDLEVLSSVMIKCDIMNFDSFSSLNRIRELKIKAISSMTLNSISSLKELKTLKVLALTSVLHLSKLELNVLAELTDLESLDLGECTDFPENFGQEVLIKLEKLEKLRLEKGQDDCHTFDLLNTVKDMKKLEQLELVNFDIKSGFDKAIGMCTQLKKLMIIPTYVSQSATTNNMVLSGVLRLQGSLTHFVWGVTLELIRVTELFVDQCEDKKNKKASGSGDSIPVLKPVPDLSNGGIIHPASNPPQVEILPLPNLQKLLLNSLPSTRVKILKIPFHATWRQTLHDSAYL